MFTVINTEWETTRQHSMKFETERMNPTEKTEALDIGQ